MMAQSLRKAGHATSEASQGDEALHALDNGPAPDLVVMDILMPDREGFETIMEARKSMPDLKILAISGGGRIGEKRYLSYAEKLGATASLAKPFGAKEFVGIVQRLLNSD